MLALVIENVGAISSANATWILTSSWELSSASASLGVEVLSVLAVGQGVESALASEVRCAEVVQNVQTISTSGTSRILAATWEADLASSSLGVEVLLGTSVVGALSQGVESSLASEVGVTQVVQDKESIATSSTSRILTSIWHC